MSTQSNSTEPETAIDGQDVATVEELTQWADQVEGERDAMIETIAELERERDALKERLDKAEWLASVIWLHYRERKDLDPCQQRHLEMANEIRNVRDAALGETK